VGLPGHLCVGPDADRCLVLGRISRLSACTAWQELGESVTGTCFCPRYAVLGAMTEVSPALPCKLHPDLRSFSGLCYVLPFSVAFPEMLAYSRSIGVSSDMSEQMLSASWCDGIVFRKVGYGLHKPMTRWCTV